MNQGHLDPECQLSITMLCWLSYSGCRYFESVIVRLAQLTFPSTEFLISYGAWVYNYLKIIHLTYLVIHVEKLRELVGYQDFLGLYLCLYKIVICYRDYRLSCCVIVRKKDKKGRNKERKRNRERERAVFPLELWKFSCIISITFFVLRQLQSLPDFKGRGYYLIGKLWMYL